MSEKTNEDALKRIEYLVSFQERCSKDMQERLVREGFSSEIAEEAVVRACSCGLINDARYAEILINSRLRSKKGKPGIERELRNLGIDVESLTCWQDAFEKHDENSEVDRALALLTAKPPRSSQPQRTAYAKLIGKGYSSSVASTASRLWWETSQ